MFKKKQNKIHELRPLYQTQAMAMSILMSCNLDVIYLVHTYIQLVLVDMTVTMISTRLKYNKAPRVYSFLVFGAKRCFDVVRTRHEHGESFIILYSTIPILINYNNLKLKENVIRCHIKQRP